MLGIPLGLLWANATEWVTHKYLLHGMGMKKGAPFSWHFHDHHQAVRKNAGADPGYHRSLLGWHPQTKEVVGLAAAAALYLPLLPVAPFFTGAVWWSIWNYHRVHKKSHLDPEWARKHVPWHYDHHMGPNQHKNWCVTKPWFDIIMGTRVPYAGTPREAADLAKRRDKAAASTATASPVAA
jgi:sterol desaturase/sphingolipid hydroxylase (fatty acid hydroxylase superfamily)